MNNQQYLWIAIVIVGLVGGIEIGYAVSTVHNHYGMHDHFSPYGKWNHANHAGYMMQDSEFRQHMYSKMFDSTQYREEMSRYLVDHPQAMQTMQRMMGHDMMGGMTHGMSMWNMSGMGNMKNMSSMMHN